MNSLIVSLILIFVSSSQISAEPDFVTEKFDKYLEKYRDIVLEKSPIAVFRSSMSTWTSSNIVPGKVITGFALINGADLFGLNNVSRHGDLITERIGQNSWSVKGTLNLSVIKISGTLNLVPSEKYNLTLPPLNINCSPYNEIEINFEAEMNFGKTYLNYKSFHFDMVKFWTSIKCPQELEEECKHNQFKYVNTYFNFAINSDLKPLLLQWLMSVPI